MEPSHGLEQTRAVHATQLLAALLSQTWLLDRDVHVEMVIPEACHGLAAARAVHAVQLFAACQAPIWSRAQDVHAPTDMVVPYCGTVQFLMELVFLLFATSRTRTWLLGRGALAAMGSVE